MAARKGVSASLYVLFWLSLKIEIYELAFCCLLCVSGGSCLLLLVSPCLSPASRALSARASCGPFLCALSARCRQRSLGTCSLRECVQLRGTVCRRAEDCVQRAEDCVQSSSNVCASRHSSALRGRTEKANSPADLVRHRSLCSRARKADRKQLSLEGRHSFPIPSPILPPIDHHLHSNSHSHLSSPF